jgi:hypothetical protein
MHTPGFVEGDLAAPLGRTGCGSHDGLAPTLAEWFGSPGIRGWVQSQKLLFPQWWYMSPISLLRALCDPHKAAKAYARQT